VKPLLALLLGFVAVSAAAAEWKLDPARSSIAFASEWNGQKVEGRFQRFSGTIRFTPEKLAETDVAIIVDLASATTADRTVNASLPGDDWLAIKTSPTARFTTRSVKAAGPGRYLAKGNLLLRGKNVPVELPFTLSIAGNTATMAGTTRLDRRVFGIGMESDASGAWVVFPVPVTIRVVATRVP
jgi:polyisoprenoid-binding protein YceI